MDNIRVLQIGTEDWSSLYAIPEYVQWYFDSSVRDVSMEYDVVILDGVPDSGTLHNLRYVARAYTLFITERLVQYKHLKKIMLQKCGKVLRSSDIQSFLSNELRFYYAGSYGKKYGCRDLSVAQNFSGDIKWNGNYSLELSADYGDDFVQVAFWRSNILLKKDQPIDLWLEYRKEDGVELALKVFDTPRGSVSTIRQTYFYMEQDLEREIFLENDRGDSNLMIGLYARGSGRLSVIGLHMRKSRGRSGVFLPGGVRHVTSDREELYSYLDPGDLKPPLCIYFGGYKTQEGFEGLKMMRSLGCPFLLLSESRLEGGAFFIGSKEYESMVQKVILSAVQKMGFHPSDMIFSGLAMGTHGALYYGCDFRPHAVIVGRPLLSLGDVAANEKHNRPGGFPTSLDLLQIMEHGMDENAVRDLNERFWERFEKADWHATRLAVAYMIEDDYDATAYRKMISGRFSKGATIYGKGFHGRHNDNTGGVAQWFTAQYKEILQYDFRRRIR